MQIILASTSPFRKSVLEKLHIPFKTISPDVDETIMKDEQPEELVKRLAIAKAQAVAKEQAASLVIGSDQVAVIGNTILGKPGDHATAVEQLQNVSGKRVTFYTGLALINADTGNIQAEVVPYHVVFRKLTDEMIDKYLKAEQPYNCAGSFKSEALGIVLFERLEGEDPNTLIGLPLIRLTRMLENENYKVL